MVGHRDERLREYRTGFVGVIGQTNVGKSTFLNAVLGGKLLMTSAKPQATRNRVRCVLTTGTAQLVFVDTPGLHRPKNTLSRHLLREAYRGLRGLDVLLYVVEPWAELHELDAEVLQRLQDLECPILLLVNKIDQAKGNALAETLVAYEATDRFAELIPMSATKGIGLDDVVETTSKYLPIAPPLFPADVKCDRPTEFLVSELIREKVFQFVHQEIPYSVAVRVRSMTEREDGLVEVDAEVLVERESQKGILVGKGGQMIKRIGASARKDIESLLGSKVFLRLIAKVRQGWTRNEQEIRQLTDDE